MKRTSSLNKQLFEVLKRKLKARSITYRDLAKTLDVSKVTVKRFFSEKRITFEQLAEIADLLGMTLTELMQMTEEVPYQSFTHEQEVEITSDINLHLVGARVFKNWTFENIVETYQISEAECIRHLLNYDRMGMIDLLPGNKIRLRAARGIQAQLNNGPMHNFIYDKLLKEFFAEPFNQKNNGVSFLHGMLTPEAIAQLQIYTRHFGQLFEELHHSSLSAPFAQRKQILMYIAHREEWDYSKFAAIKRNKNANST